MRALRRRWLVPVIVVAAWAAIVAFQMWRATGDARAGIDQLEAIRDQARLEDVFEGDIDVRLARAGDRLSAAAAAVDHPAVAPLRLLPFAGRHVRSADALLTAAGQTASVARDAVASARKAVGDEDLPGGMGRVDLLRSLSDVAADAGGRLGRIDLGPSRALVGPLARARQDLSGELRDLRGMASDAASALDAAAGLLHGPSRYLVLAANNAEMRIGSGMFLSSGILEMEDGHLRLGEMGRSPDVEVPVGSVEPTGDLAARWGWTHPEREWRNLAFTPRFGANAELAARMWEAAGRGPVDGVLAVDVVAVEAILAATGPVHALDRTVRASDVVEYLLHGQYAELSDDPTERFRQGEQLVRRERIGDLAGAAVSALESRDWSIATFLRELHDAVEGRHVLAWSRHAEEATLFDVAGVAGELLPDSLSIGLANVAGSKLDPLIGIRAAWAAAPSEDSTAIEIRVEIRNRARSSEPAYILGPDPGTEGLGPGDYRGILVANLPGAAYNGRIDGVDHLVAVGRDGPTRVVAATVEVPRGERRTFVIQFDLPSRVRQVLVEPSARIPSIRWQAPGTRWRDEERRRLPVLPGDS